MHSLNLIKIVEDDKQIHWGRGIFKRFLKRVIGKRVRYLLYSSFNHNLLTVCVLSVCALLMCLKQFILPTAQ